MGQSLALCGGICRIFCYKAYKCICCVPDAKYLPVCHTICVGLSGVGKSRMLAVLNNENIKTEPTIGFNIKAVKLDNCILNIKELGGGNNVRKFWSKYFVNVESLMILMKVDSFQHIYEEMRIQKQQLSVVFDLHKDHDIPMMVIVLCGFTNESDESRAIICEFLKENTSPNKSVILIINDFIKDCEKIKETMSLFCLRFLLN